MSTLGEADITGWLARWGEGDLDALDRVLPQVYDELRRLAAHTLRGHRDHDTLQPTALVHDVFVRLLGARSVDIRDRKHLFTTAAKLMRQVLVDRARAAQRDKRGGGHWQQVEWVELLHLPIEADMDLAELDEALKALARHDERMAQIVEWRCFGGLEVLEVANLLEVDERTVYRDWAMAKAWLRQALDAT
jgi:RNA polymerase sigma factor (TIGR02999 family)